MITDKFTNGMPREINAYFRALAQKRSEEEKEDPDLKNGPLVDVQICRGKAILLLSEKNEAEPEAEPQL